MTRASPRVLLVGLLAACDEDRAALDLDGLVAPDRECVVLVHESLDLGGPIVEFVSDVAGSPGGWALVSTAIDDDPMLTLVRVPARADEPPTQPIVVADDPVDAPNFHLRAGLELGTAWLLRGPDTGEPGPVRLRKLAPGVGELASNVLDNFPADEGAGVCPEQWSRRLLLIEGRPFMLAIPDCSDGPAVDLQLLALDEQTLEFLTYWTLAFDPCTDLDPVTCAQVHSYKLEAIEAGQSTHMADASRVMFGFTQVRAFDTGIPSGDDSVLRSSDVSLLDLRVNASGPEARLLTFREVWITVAPLPLGPVQLAQDHHSVQIFVPNLIERSDSALIRLDTVNSDLYVPASGEDVLPYEGGGELIQLEYDSAMFAIAGEPAKLHATPLVDVDVWGSFDSQVLHEDAELASFESAGPGALLIRRYGLPEQIMHVACMPEDE